MKKAKIEEFKKEIGNVGLPEYQIATLTEEILNLTEHLQKNPKDLNSKRGLILKVARRRKLLKYLEKKSAERYQKLKKALDL
ncbi:MAG: 30S ribosomal protein S15 [Minisyncoccia bacterium]